MALGNLGTTFTQQSEVRRQFSWHRHSKRGGLNKQKQVNSLAVVVLDLTAPESSKTLEAGDSERSAYKKLARAPSLTSFEEFGS